MYMFKKTIKFFLSLGFLGCSILSFGAIRINFPSNDTAKNDSTLILFAPGQIASNAIGSLAPAFSPDGKMVLIGQQPRPGECSIMESNLVDNKWIALQYPSFAGKFRDLEPVFAPDGRYLVFASNRPVTDGGALLDRLSGAKLLPGKGGNLWKVERSDKGWGSPERLPELINSNSAVFSPALTADGSLYFMRSDSGKTFHIYRSQMRNGKYETPVPFQFTSPKYADYDPAVAPDESFVIFSSAGRPPALKTTDLFIIFCTENGWTEPIDLRSVLSDNVNGVEPRLSPDCKTLYFANSRNASGVEDTNGSYTWMVNISALLKAHGIKNITPPSPK